MTAAVADLRAADRLGDGEQARWRDLAVNAAVPNPFFEPEFAIPAFRELRPRGGGLLVAEGTDGSWLGCLPVHRPRRWRRVAIPAIAGWRHDYCFLGVPLLRRGAEAEAARALLAGALQSTATYVGLELLPVDGPAWAPIQSAAAELGAKPLVYEEIERACVHKRSDEPLPAISRKHQRDIERLGRRLADAVGAPARAVDRSDDESAVEAFLKLEHDGWKGRQGDSLLATGHDALFREVCSRFRSQGRLELIGLEADEKVLALKVNLLSGGWVLCFKIAFDEEHAKFSPGIQLELANLKRFAEQSDAVAMDSCAEPENAMINRLWSGRRALRSIAVPVSGLRSVPVRGAIMVGAKANRRGEDSRG